MSNVFVLYINVSVRTILHQLCDLFTIYHIRKALASLLEDNFITGQQARLITSTLAICCYEIRTQCIPLVDAFHYSDDLVRSPLGRYDGNVYEGNATYTYIMHTNTKPKHEWEMLSVMNE